MNIFTAMQVSQPVVLVHDVDHNTSEINLQGLSRQLTSAQGDVGWKSPIPFEGGATCSTLAQNGSTAMHDPQIGVAEVVNGERRNDSGVSLPMVIAGSQGGVQDAECNSPPASVGMEVDGSESLPHFVDPLSKIIHYNLNLPVFNHGHDFFDFAMDAFEKKPENQSLFLIIVQR